MGSMSRLSAIEKVISAFESEILNYFSDIVGMIIGKLEEEELDVEYWIGANVLLTGLSEWEGIYVHFRWATEEELNLGREKDGSIVSDFNEFIAGKKIISISLGAPDRDDEVYLFANIDEYNSLEIPLGFNPETFEFSGFLEEILSEEKLKDFEENYANY